MHESVPRLTDVVLMPLFVAFVASLLLSAKYSIQLLLGKQNHYRPVEILCALTATAVICFLTRDGMDWWYSHPATAPLPFWGVVLIALAIVASRLHFQFANLKLPAGDLRRSTIVWGVMFCSLGTTYWSAHRLHAEGERGKDILVEAEFSPAAGSMKPADASATTDRGRVILLYHWQNTPSQDAPSSTPNPPHEDYPAMIIARATPDTNSNCHGWVFTGGKYFVLGGTVEMILDDNGYLLTQAPRTGDLVIHRSRTSEIQHTGLVRGVLDDGTVLEESKWGAAGGRFLHHPDSQPYGAATYYRSPRQGHLLTITPGSGDADARIAAPKAEADQSGNAPTDRTREPVDVRDESRQ